MKKIFLMALMGVSVVMTGCFGANKYEPISIESQSGQIYVDHTQALENEAQANNQPYVLFFHAAWCPNCRALQDEMIDNLDSMPKNTKIFRLNYDKEEILKEKYGINNQTMVVYFDSEGNNKGKKLNPTLDEIKKFFLSQPMNKMKEEPVITEETETETEEVADTDDETNKTEEVSQTETTTVAAIYAAYSAEAESAANEAGQNYVLFFHAAWCSSCKALDEVIANSLDQLPANTVVLKVDYDSQTEMRKQYGVTQQHTLVGIQNGEVTGKNIGGQLKDLLELLS